METSAKPSSSGLHVALAKANSGKPYLGDPRVIDSLVRQFVGGACRRIGEVADDGTAREDAVAADKAALFALADILAGKHDSYETIGNWNPCGLASYVAMLCLNLEGCIGFARNYIAMHPDGMSLQVRDCCCTEH